MDYIKFENLNFEEDKSEYKSFEWEGQEVKVIQHLPMATQAGIISMTLQRSKDTNLMIYNPILVDAFFHLFITICYTNIEINENVSEIDAYEKISNSGFLDLVIVNMNKEEYNNLFEIVNELKERSISTITYLSKYIEDCISKLPEAINVVNKLKNIKN